jgi:hypothetical protein
VEHDAGHAPHEVLRALTARRRTGSRPGARDDDLRIALAIEGGGMRGVISAGMALARHASPDGRRPPRSARLLARTTLRRETPALRATFLARESRRTADDQILADYEAASAATSVPATHPAVVSIRPAAGSPAVSRLATDGALLRAALEAGRAAAHATLDACAPPP